MKILTVVILTAAAVAGSAAEPEAPSEAQCHDFIRQYYAAKDLPKAKPPTAAQVRQWHICTSTYASAMELSTRIIKQRQQARE